MSNLVAIVARRNGAWMVQFVGNEPSDWTTGDQVDCASSLVVAKRIAKEGARTYASKLRWNKVYDGYWHLNGEEEEVSYKAEEESWS